MEVPSYTAILPVKDIAKTRLPVKVCMHLLSTARTDPRVLREATALVEAGFSVSIIDIEAASNQPVEEDIQGVCVKHIIMPGSFITTRFSKWALARAAKILIHSTLRLIRTPTDIYHAHDLSALPASYIVARLRRKPLIFDAHELPLAEVSSGLFSRMRGLLAWPLARMIAYSAGVITVSPPIAREIRDRYHAPTVSLVRNVCPYQVIQKNDRLRQSLGISPDVRLALYQGSLHLNRGLDRLIRAAKFLEHDIVIVIMGQGSKELEAQLEALIASEAVAERVKILPPVPYIELLDWTASADLGLIVYSPDYSLNVQWCLPNKLFEYLMAGLPILASQLDAVAEVIKTYDVGQIVTSLAPADVGAAINRILADPVALARMRHNALDAAQDELCWEKERQQLVRLYHDILGARR